MSEERKVPASLRGPETGAAGGPVPSRPAVVEAPPEAPVTFIEGDQPAKPPKDGIGLCLSGGGYKAMLFHLGAIWRLNEVGILGEVDRVSSVSGGSITAGVLGLNWTKLDWQPDAALGGALVARRFEELVVRPVRFMATRTIDVLATIMGVVVAGTASKRVAAAYRKHLFKDATLQDLPDEGKPTGQGGGPRFTINATNLQSGVLFRFCRAHMADYTVGLVRKPTLSLATAVAASSAFPPILSPTKFKVDPASYEMEAKEPLNWKHRGKLVLTDGGVYDNLGMETVWKNFRTVLVSDAGGGADYWDPKADANWFKSLWRVFWVQRYQVGGLRRRQLVESFKAGRRPNPDPVDALWRRGAYWGITTPYDDFHVPDPLAVSDGVIAKIAATPVRLKALSESDQQGLINWGYAVCDAAIRRYVRPSIAPPIRLPYPNRPIG